ncbi:MAG: tryptophan 2,3-dioxygenase family protein [Acidobacteriota bacterium]|nr:tryptophan 2,3-dioxygenase family protein [Acidobacteriota bacterium]
MSGPRQPAKALTYSSYLALDELLTLQRPKSSETGEPEHDELLFIIIHQVYELWFKQINHEILNLQSALEEGDAPSALASFKRVLTILKILVAQVDILETMTPMSFGSFRERLESASGFQSAQFRETEFLLGHRDPRVFEHHTTDTAGGRRLRQLVTEPSLYDSFLRFLDQRGLDVPTESLERDVSQPLAASEDVQAVLLAAYRDDHLAEAVCERMVDLDEGLQEWRYRHVKMVERTIGSKTGTGGSAGTAYLKKTLFQPLFPDLWAIRDRL